MKKLITLFTIVLLILACQEKKTHFINHENIGAESDEIFDKLVKVRRDFHKNPELAPAF